MARRFVSSILAAGTANVTSLEQLGSILSSTSGWQVVVRNTPFPGRKDAKCLRNLRHDFLICSPTPGMHECMYRVLNWTFLWTPSHALQSAVHVRRFGTCWKLYFQSALI